MESRPRALNACCGRHSLRWRRVAHPPSSGALLIVLSSSKRLQPRPARRVRRSIAQARTLDCTQYRDLLLVAEILSPSTTPSDRFQKRRLYQEVAIPVYWIVDGGAQQVEVWTPDARFPQIERERLVWHPAGAATPFSLPLMELFKPI